MHTLLFLYYCTFLSLHFLYLYLLILFACLYVISIIPLVRINIINNKCQAFVLKMKFLKLLTKLISYRKCWPSDPDYPDDSVIS